MSFGTRYRGRLAGDDGSTYVEVRLLQRDYGGSSTLSELTDTPVVVEYGRRGADTFVPILASHARVEGWRLSSADLAAIGGSRTGDWQMEIYHAETLAERDSSPTLVWRGLVLTDIYSDSTESGPQKVTVEAVDGLSTLKDQPFYEVVSGERKAITGQGSLLSIAIDALKKIGWELPIRTSIAWRPDGAAGDPLAELRVNRRSFYRQDGKAFTCYEVLEEIARRLGARLVLQQVGDEPLAWWFVSRERLGAAVGFYRYTSAGVQDGPLDGVATTISAADAPLLRGDRSYRPAYGSVRIVHNHGTIPPLLDAGEFASLGGVRKQQLRKTGRDYVETAPVYSPATWTHEGHAEPQEVARAVVGESTGRQFAHTVDAVTHAPQDNRNPLAMKAKVLSGGVQFPPSPGWAQGVGSDVAEDQIVSFNGSVLIRREFSGQKLYNTYFSLNIQGTDYYLKRDGSWGESSSELDRMQSIAPLGVFPSTGIAPGAPLTFNFISLPAPATGALQLRVYGTSDDQLPGFREAGRTEWRDVQVLVVDESGAEVKQSVTEVFATDEDGYPLPDPPRAEVSLRLGQIAAAGLNTRLLWDTTPAEDWISPGRLDDPVHLDVLHAESMLRQQAQPLEVRHETYRALMGASPVRGVELGSKVYTVDYLSVDYYRSAVDVELVEYVFDFEPDVQETSAPERWDDEPPIFTWPAPIIDNGLIALELDDVEERVERQETDEITSRSRAIAGNTWMTERGTVRTEPVVRGFDADGNPLPQSDFSPVVGGAIYDVDFDPESVSYDGTELAATIDAGEVTGATHAVYFEADGIRGHEFEENDLILSEHWDREKNLQYQCRAEVLRVSADGSWAALAVGSDDPPLSGVTFVRVGNTVDTDRQGSVYFNTSGAGSPAVRVLDNIDSFAALEDEDNIKYQAGRLLFDDTPFGALDTFGNYTRDSFLEGKIFALEGSDIAGWVTTEDSIVSPGGEITLHKDDGLTFVSAPGFEQDSINNIVWKNSGGAVRASIGVTESEVLTPPFDDEIPTLVIRGPRRLHIEEGVGGLGLEVLGRTVGSAGFIRVGRRFDGFPVPATGILLEYPSSGDEGPMTLSASSFKFTSGDIEQGSITSGGILQWLNPIIAADPTAATHVVNRQFGDGRYSRHHGTLGSAPSGAKDGDTYWNFNTETYYGLAQSTWIALASL